MNIPSNRVFKGDAFRRVAASETAGSVVLTYATVITVSAALVTLINYCLGLQIDKTGGLSSMGLRSVLSTFQSVLPMLQNALVMCMQVGYVAAMMRVARRQYTSVQTLKLGFDRFWLLLRTMLLQGLFYMAVCMVTFWVSAQIFLFTPMAASVSEIMAPAISGGNLQIDVLLSDALYGQLLQAMIPLFLICGVLYAIVMIPLFYSFRMVSYIIVDKPALSGFAVLKESRNMMKGHRIRLFRLDLGLWLWYLLSFLTTLVCYGDSLLPMLGIQLPMGEDIAYFLFYGLFLALQFFLAWQMRNQVEVSYALFYDAVRPKEPETGAVLGNIFQM